MKELLELLDITSERKVDLKKKLINFHGYSFVFRDPFNTIKPYMTVKFSSKFSSAGFWRKILEKSMNNLENVKSLDELNLEDIKFDFCFGGSLKTIIPSLKFGGYETLFFVWMFVKTPKGKIFPATFYYGQSGTSLGGWYLSEAKKVFPSNYYSIINFSPFNFTDDELEAFIEALECSLRMVPVSDYYGIYQGDMGYTLMGVKKGRPFLMELGYSYDDKLINKYLEML